MTNDLYHHLLARYEGHGEPLSESELQRFREEQRQRCDNPGVGDDRALRIEMGTREALEEALLALEQRAIDNDTASPEGHKARLAIEHINRMLEQRGLEVFENGDDGSLPDFCDVVIFG